MGVGLYFQKSVAAWPGLEMREAIGVTSEFGGEFVGEFVGEFGVAFSTRLSAKAASGLIPEVDVKDDACDSVDMG
jgi:hypothetical protein